MNQLAFPGLGTILSGRRLTGYPQATIMVGGFLLVVGFFVWMMICTYQVMTGTLSADEVNPQYLRRAWIVITGFGLCAVAWGWALISSFEILRTSVDPDKPSPPG